MIVDKKFLVHFCLLFTFISPQHFGQWQTGACATYNLTNKYVIIGLLLLWVTFWPYFIRGFRAKHRWLKNEKNSNLLSSKAEAKLKGPRKWWKNFVKLVHTCFIVLFFHFHSTVSKERDVNGKIVDSDLFTPPSL